MSRNNTDVIIIGAGLSGLACACKLKEHGLQVLVLEKSDAPGGRARTDEVEGYLLDRGFQVYLDSYPTAGKTFDLPALNLHKFEPGAMVFSEGKLHQVMDVFRRPRYLLASALAPIGNLFDKALIARLRRHLRSSSLSEIADRENLSTRDYLRRFGFSERMLDGFFRSFYGGIFLERELRTSSRMFEFTFKMFSEGSATLPSKGMGELAGQLARRLDSKDLRFHSEVEALSGQEVRLTNGELLSAKHIVIATPGDTASSLLPHLKLPRISWRSVTNLYFTAEQSPLQQPILALNGEQKGLVNNVAVLSDISPTYAPDGKALISVSILGLPEQENLPELVKTELGSWFGEQVKNWQHLRTDRIPKALPEQLPEAPVIPRPEPPHYLCGDYEVSTSIEGAIISGQKAADRILQSQS